MTVQAIPQNAAPNHELPDLIWPEKSGDIPDWIYTDPRVYELEQKRIFQGATWNYVGLEVEIPKRGDFIRSYVGSVPVIVVRDLREQVRVFENRCAHRGAEFCKSYRGNSRSFVCPYHHWTYDLTGKLAGVPFRNGVDGKGGYPEDFNLSDHNLRSLNVTVLGGAIFASFSQDMPSLEDYLGPELYGEFTTIFSGRKLKMLGIHRNVLQGNWKLYQENLKDPYHATLLHTYLTTFGLFVAGNKTGIVADKDGRHSALLNAKPEGRPDNDASKAEIRSFKAAMQLADPSILEFNKEFDSPWTSSAITIWPNLILIRQLNILSLRMIVPQGPNEFMLVWTAFGYEDDSPELEQHRLRQNNIFGPGGFLGIDDNEALRFVQDGIKRSLPRHGVASLGKDVEPMDTVITDRAIRSMYKHYREVMGL
ncbi:Rieske 2Fe-2S domain-containing protein [Ferrovibrio sp.]|uniref:aromatic ring-hydroxylating oxygenase subunit alpha n=1 Tax=Ferrovibrio sp. TaxID=1917215 RepID=UPI0025BF9D89|nr:Rieske 2Fe-2S domain-containing protein [Ferrovibrio sp.]MBX3453650.1 Rieske 2Fe-2S domain-containing protein [Ferrovibrio sp.]